MNIDFGLLSGEYACGATTVRSRLSLSGHNSKTNIVGFEVLNGCLSTRCQKISSLLITLMGVAPMEQVNWLCNINGFSQTPWSRLTLECFPYRQRREQHNTARNTTAHYKRVVLRSSRQEYLLACSFARSGETTSDCPSERQ